MDDADNRIKCWAYGVRLQESVGFLLRSVQLMAEEEPANDTDRVIYDGIMEVHVRNIDRLLRDAESCGVEANGYISGQFVGVQNAVKASPSSVALDVVKKFSMELHQAAVDEIIRTG